MCDVILKRVARLRYLLPDVVSAGSGIPCDNGNVRPTRSQTRLIDLQLIILKKKKNPAARDKSQAGHFMAGEVKGGAVKSRH